MPIIPPPPSSIFDCDLLKALASASSVHTGTYEKTTSFIKAAAPLVDMTISGPFATYTLHNRDHSKKLIHLAGYLLGPALLKGLTELDLQLFIYAAFIHDMGMTLTSIERERILKSADFQDEVQGWPALSEAFRSTNTKLSAADSDDQRSLLAAELYQLQEAGLASYLRPRHGQPARYRELLTRINSTSDRQDLFTNQGVSFEDILIEVCASHILDVGVLSETKSAYTERFPRRHAIGGIYFNAQFCAALLRITDILDFDRERTPRILFESLGIAKRSLPGADVTLREWQKHLAVHTTELDQREFVVSAQSHHPVIERSIREFCAVIEREFRDTLAVLRRNPNDITVTYLPELPITVRANITSIGYVYRDLALSLNQSQILNLLMGDRLYNHPAAAIRELLQNSLDACLVRERMQGASYKSKIEVSEVIDAEGRYWVVVSDNGIGMDEHVLSEYFLTLGNSYYRSAEFLRTSVGYNPISRFGIGIAAVFMIADVLEIRTRSVKSPRGDHQGRIVRIEGILSLAFVTEADVLPEGTEIRLLMKKEFASERIDFGAMCLAYLQSAVAHPKIPVALKLSGTSLTLSSAVRIKPRSETSGLLAAKRVEMPILDLGRWSDRISGTVALFFHVSPSGELCHKKDGKALRIGPLGLDPRTYLDGYPGNRFSVNGFSMSVKGLTRIFGKSKEKIAIVYDLDVSADDEIQYDISRQKVIGVGRVNVIKLLETAIITGLRETGVYDRFTAETKAVFSGFGRRTSVSWASWSRYTLKSFSPVADAALLQEVLRLVPSEPWPVAMHKTIAKELGISNALAARAISTLLASGKLVRSSELHPPS